MSKQMLCALLVVASGGVARADEPVGAAGRGEAPVVDVADLPPLPEAEDAPVSSATVLAASAVSEDVVVGAAKREQSLGNVASAVTVVSGDRIRRFGYRTLGEAIAGVAGAYLVDDRLAYSIGIRGLQIPGDFNTRLLVLIDGASVNEAWGAFAGLGYEAMVSIDEVARIEVIRGPVSSFYGTNAFFGTINIVTRGAAENRGVWATAAVNSVNGPTASAGFTVGDVGRQLRGNVHFMNRIGDTTHEPDISDAALTDDAAYAIGGGLSGVYGGSFAQVRAYRYSRQSPFAPYDVDPTGRPYELHDTQVLAEGGHTEELSPRLSLTARAYGNFYQYDDNAPPAAGDPLITVGTAQTGGAEVRVRYELLESGKLGLTAGTEANINDTHSSFHEGDGPDEMNIKYLYENDGTYAELDAEPVPWFGATAGLRYDIHHDAATGYRTKPSPRVALFFSQPEKYGLKLLYTEGFRVASAFESYFQDGSDFAPNRLIDPEEIRSFEAILWAKPIPGLSLRLSGFQWTVSKFIEQETVVDDPNPSYVGLQQFQNGGKLRSVGVEAEGTYRDSRGWYAFGGFAYSHVGETELDATTGTFGSDFVYGQTANAPAITGSGGVSTPRLFGLFHVSTELNYIGPRPTRPQSDGSASPDDPAWVGWNATIYAPGISGFDITAGVRNIIGTRDLVPTPGDYDRTINAAGAIKVISRVPAEGREFYVKVGYAY